MGAGGSTPGKPYRSALHARLLAGAALPLVAVVVPAVVVVVILIAAGQTLGYDYLMYDSAARRVMIGAPLYDLSFSAPGPNGLFDYPTPFILAVLPFAAFLPAGVAAIAWIAMLNLCFVVGVVVLPVRRATRWTILLLAGISWPYLYAIKLGQLGPLLFLLYAIAWRWADRPWAVAVACAVGTAAKLQPILLFGWAFVTRRYRAFALGVAILVVGGVAAAAIAGAGSLTDWLTLISRVSGHALTAPGVDSVGAIAYRAGASTEVASVIQWSSAVVVGVVALISWVRYPPEIAIPVTAIASILVSPIVWPHYAVLLLLPVAVLLDRRQWWAAALPILPWLPADAVYSMVFAIALIAPIVLGERMRRRPGTVVPRAEGGPARSMEAARS
jgi:hypothetical protein